MGTGDYFPEGSDSENEPSGDSGSDTTNDYPSGRPAGQGPHPNDGQQGGGNGGMPPMPQAWLALIESFPNWEGRIRKYYAAAWSRGDNMGRTLTQLTKLIEKTIQSKKDAKKAAEEASPWETTISNSYFDIWGEDIPDTELEYAKSEGMNAYEFVQYQRSKSAFTETQLFEHESTGLAGTLANAFGFGGNFNGSMSPIKGSGAFSQ